MGGYYLHQEEHTQKLADAFTIARSHFPHLPVDQLIEGLELCIANDGLYTIPASGMLFAFVRFDPRNQVEDRTMLEVINEFNIDFLKSYDLSEGPVVHVVAFVARHNGYRLFRELIDALNPFGVSGHRQLKDGSRVLFMRKNVRFRKNV